MSSPSQIHSSSRQTSFQQDVVGVVAANSKEFIEAVFKCQEQGLVSVPLPDADEAERRTSAGVTRLIVPGHTSGWVQANYRPGPAECASQILFTSGTTGTPKGIVLTEGSIQNTVDRLNA